MTDRHDTRTAQTRELVAHVCAQLDRIRTSLETYDPDGPAPLESLLAALRDGQDPTASLDSLHDALLAAGDAMGIHGHTRGLNPLGVDTAGTDEWVLLCPTSQCARYAWPDGPQVLHCKISGQPLRKERL